MNLNERRLLKDIENLEKNSCNYTYNKNNKTFKFIIIGPKDSNYEDMEFKLRVEIPQDYPFKSPSVGFITKIFHPNVDERSGSICLDVLNQKWSAIYDLVNIFNIFIPQLLMYPNPKDPLNSHAAELMLTNPDLFKKQIKDFNIKNNKK